MQQKDDIMSLNQECVNGSSRRKRREEYQSMVKHKVVDKFCYLGGMLSVDGDADAAMDQI